jgi:hypothetical protein
MATDQHTSVEVSSLPKCDLCNPMGFPGGHQEVAEYDGRTKQGPWANMCKRHFKQHGVGLGLGKGQRLVLRKG